MKKFLIAAVASFIIFGGQANAQVEMQEMGTKTHLKDKYILNRENSSERRDKKTWERKRYNDFRSRARYRRVYGDDFRHDPPTHYRYTPPEPTYRKKPSKPPPTYHKEPSEPTNK